MSKLHFTTKHANAASVQRKWHIVDGTNQTVGRISSKIAAVLRGKNKAYYSPHVDCGDFVIVINADKVVFTGTKIDYKEYQNVSGYPGGQSYLCMQVLSIHMVHNNLLPSNSNFKTNSNKL